MGIFDRIKKALTNNSEKPAGETAENLEEFDQEFEAVIEASIIELNQSRTPTYNFKLHHLVQYTTKVKHWEHKKTVAFLIDCCAYFQKPFKVTFTFGHNDPEIDRQVVRSQYVEQLLKAKLPLDEEDVARIVTAFAAGNHRSPGGIQVWPVPVLIQQICTQYKGKPISAGMRATVQLLKSKFQAAKAFYTEKEFVKLVEAIDALLFESSPAAPEVKPTKFLGDDSFSTYANEVVAQLPETERTLWYPLISLAQTASGSKPSAKFLNASKQLFQQIGTEKFKRVVSDWFTFVIGIKEKETQHTQLYNGQVYTHSTYEFLSAVNVEAIKGFVWMCAHFHDSATLQMIAKLAGRCYKKIPNVGHASAGLGNACLFTLYKSEGLEGIGHLSRLKLRTRQHSTLALIDKYLGEAAAAQGLSIAEIEDLAVDDHGLVSGKRTWQLEDITFEVELVAPGKTAQRWIKPDGTAQKSEPASIKAEHATALKQIKAIVKQVEQSSITQRDRIDRLFRNDRWMAWEYFQQYYLQHGLLGWLSKKLIWRFEHDGQVHGVLWSANGWLNGEGTVVNVQQGSKVALWHPATASVAEVAAWRQLLIHLQIQQPLKQAFREVYLLTEAEMNTGTYSNRMAAHVLKQHQFNSLAKARGWKYALRGGFDSGTLPTASLALPAYGIAAEYWIDEVNAHGTLNAASIWDYISTDQVRFVRAATGQVMELIDVPAIAFSEVMRDVDLFVGVASVGNDPTWRDTGGLPGYNEYWQSYSFGNLGEVAKMRKEILTGLLPRLRIKNVARIEGNFLIVQGKLRTYKIHIGSGNILMEPNDQYLCIVPDRSSKSPTGNVFLPFEGDNGLSIVLSKAFLLIDDDKITDSSITSQIGKP